MQSFPIGTVFTAPCPDTACAITAATGSRARGNDHDGHDDHDECECVLNVTGQEPGMIPSRPSRRRDRLRRRVVRRVSDVMDVPFGKREHICDVSE